MKILNKMFALLLCLTLLNLGSLIVAFAAEENNYNDIEATYVNDVAEITTDVYSVKFPAKLDIQSASGGQGAITVLTSFKELGEENCLHVSIWGRDSDDNLSPNEFVLKLENDPTQTITMRLEGAIQEKEYKDNSEDREPITMNYVLANENEPLERPAGVYRGKLTIQAQLRKSDHEKAE